MFIKFTTRFKKLRSSSNKRSWELEMSRLLEHVTGDLDSDERKKGVEDLHDLLKSFTNLE